MTRRAVGARAAASAAALAAFAMLAGCVSLPTDGPVSSLEITTEQQEADVTLGPPRSPSAGATPEEIVQGFIAAGVGPTDGYAVAREFLSESFAPEWSPNERVLVVQSRGAPVQLAGSQYALDLTVEAVVDGVGRYAASMQPAAERLEFEVVEEDGEWRIASAPNGTVVASVNLANVLAPSALEFFDPSFRYLVPDVRWFPRTPNAAGRIVRALLEGPAPWLSGAVATTFPTGTQLAGGIEVADGVANVELSPEALSVDTAGRRRMLQQLQSSLTTLDTIVSVELTVGDIPVDLPDVDVRLPERDLGVDPRPLALVQGRLGFAAGADLDPLGALGEAAVALEPAAISAARPGAEGAIDRLAVLGPDGVSSVAGGGATLLDARSGLVAPTTDPHGWTWTSSAAAPGTVRAYGPGGARIDVPAAGVPDGATLVAIELSRDGTRALAAYSSPAGPSLRIASIVRDEDLAPVGFGDPVPLPVGTSAILDVAWVDSSTVAVLEGADGRSRVRVLQVGGTSRVLSGTTDAMRIVGGDGGIEGIRLLAGDGAVLAPSSSGGWRRTGLVATLLATQQ